jgi:hypothetical protein
MKGILGVLLVCLVAFVSNTGCEQLEVQKPFECDTAYVRINNPSDKFAVIYGYRSPNSRDTLFPGESFVSKHVGVSNNTVYSFMMYTKDGGFTVDVDECYKEIDAVNGYENLTSLCNNGRFDPYSGETDVDCGGNCKKCPTLVMPCNVAENYVDFTAISGLGADDDNLFSSRIESISYPVITNFELNNGVNFRVTIYLDSLPNTTRKLITGTENQQIRLILNTRTGAYYVFDGQELYFVKISNGKYKLSFCDLDFYGGFANKHVLANGNMEFEY